MQLRYGLPAELVVARGTAVARYDLQAKPGPRTREFTSARHDEKRHADQVNIDSWRSG